MTTAATQPAHRADARFGALSFGGSTERGGEGASLTALSRRLQGGGAFGGRHTARQCLARLIREAADDAEA